MRFPLSILFPLASLTTPCCVAWLIPATAQIIPDQTLGVERSNVTPNVRIRGINSDLIDGGAIRNSNLFHSFREFNIKARRGAYFVNPVGIENILTRVTGENVSNIFGTLGVLGGANLFLINPNGIVFGPNARLDVGGSFFASTADGILFENGVEFAASNPEAPPLLTINIPLGLNIRENPGTIVNQTLSQLVDSDGDTPTITPLGLYVPPEKTIALIGGEVRFESGVIASRGSHLELGGLSEPGIVELNPDGSLNFPLNVQRANISLTNSAIARVDGNPGGNIGINARNLEISGGSQVINGVRGVRSLLNIAEEENLDAQPSQAGDIRINVTESVTLTDKDTAIGNQVFSNATGNAGNVDIQTNSLFIRDGALVSASTLGNGNGGSLTVRASESLELVGVISGDPFPNGLFAEVELEATGNGGTLTIETQRLILSSGAQISTSTFGVGDAGDLAIKATEVELVGTVILPNDEVSSGLFVAGDIGKGGNLTLDTQRLIITSGAQILGGTFGPGNGGNLIVRANEVELIGTSATGQSSGLFAGVEPKATGRGGSLTIDTQRLTLSSGAQVSTSTFGLGDAGNVMIKATEIELIGLVIDPKERPISSGLFTQVGADSTGKGGTLRIETEHLRLSGGAQISAASRIDALGDAGDLAIQATEVELMGTVILSEGEVSSGLFVAGNIGQGGNLTLDTQRLIITDGAQISAVTFGAGDARNLTVTANEVELIGTSATGRSSGLLAGVGNLQTREATGQGGDLTLETERLIISGGAGITTTTAAIGNAGDLTVTANEVELIGTDANGEPSGLFARTREQSIGDGGTLRVTADELTVRDGASITVSSLGEGEAGNLEINAPSIRLNNQASLSAETRVGTQGNITINSSDVRLREGSAITTNSLDTGTGGNITINSNQLVAIENSDISANALAGSGGQVIINSDAIFGTQFRQQQTSASDITATSELGAEFSGTVELNNEIDPAQGLVDLPQTVVDPAALIAQDVCRQGEGSEFVNTGRGGLPPSPEETVRSEETFISLMELPPEVERRNNSQTQRNSRSLTRQRRNTSRTNNQPISSLDIVPARGWIRTKEGEIILVGYDPTKTGVQRQRQRSTQCQP